MENTKLVARAIAIKMADQYERLNRLKVRSVTEEKEKQRLEGIKNLLEKVGVK